MTTPYYADDSVTLYLGDCLEVCEWLAADVLVTDPPYGRGWTSGSGMTNGEGRGLGSVANGGIANDNDTSVRDIALELWLMMPRDERPAVVRDLISPADYQTLAGPWLSVTGETR